MSEGRGKRLTTGERAVLLVGCLGCAWIKGQLLYEALRDGKAWFPRSHTTTLMADDPERFWTGVGVTAFWLVLSIVIAAALAADWLRARGRATASPTKDA